MERGLSLRSIVFNREQQVEPHPLIIHFGGMKQGKNYTATRIFDFHVSVTLRSNSPIAIQQLVGCLPV